MTDGPASACLAALLAFERADMALEHAEAEFRWLVMEGASDDEQGAALARIAPARHRRERAHEAYVRAAMAMHAYAVDRPAPERDPRVGS